MAKVIRYAPENLINLPVSGAGTALVDGAMLKGNVSTGPDWGHLILATGASATPDILGILRGAHAVALDVDTAGTVFNTSPVDMITPFRIVEMEISQASADLVTCTQAVTGTTMTVTSLEDDLDASFLYVVTGTGAGQTNYLTAAASGSCTLKAAFATNLDTTSKFIKILGRFHKIAAFSADGTKLTSQAGAGAIAVNILDIIVRLNGITVSLDPTKHAALTKLNNDPQLKFFAQFTVRDTIPYSIV